MNIAMSLKNTAAKSPPLNNWAKGSLFLQRKCACGSTTSSLTGECEECMRGKQIGVQPKLKVNEPNDHYEQEADRIADEIVRSDAIDGASRLSPIHAVTRPITRVQRQEVEDVDVQSEEDEEEIKADDSGMPKREQGVAGTVMKPSESLNIPQDNGHPLEADVQQTMGQRMGYDFSHVRIHTDADAIRSARQIKAHAYTLGRDIYFNQGRYNPHDFAGLKLLTHELTHVVQQGGGAAAPGGMVQRKGAAATAKGKKTVPACTGACAGSKAPIHSGCTDANGSPAVASEYIQDLSVHRAAHQVIATWSSGSINTWDCSPSTKSGKGGKVPTPLVKNDMVGVKCDKCHTNRHGDGMGWFTGFSSRGRAIGFHNSQLVGAKFESHGCVRVSCDIAKTIHDHSSSGVTTINVTA